MIAPDHLRPGQQAAIHHQHRAGMTGDLQA
jgi:hypothetical protein